MHEKAFCGLRIEPFVRKFSFFEIFPGNQQNGSKTKQILPTQLMARFWALWGTLLEMLESARKCSKSTGGLLESLVVCSKIKWFARNSMLDLYAISSCCSKFHWCLLEVLMVCSKVWRVARNSGWSLETLESARNLTLPARPLAAERGAGEGLRGRQASPIVFQMFSNFSGKVD